MNDGVWVANFRRILTWCFAAMLVAVAADYVRYDSYVTDAHDWPSIEAVITQSELRKGCNKGAGFSPEIYYKYTINGRPFQGSRIIYALSKCDSEDAIASFIKMHPTGSKLTVHVNPKSPNESLAFVDK